LALNIYFEAANQSTAGRLAVALVTHNRVQAQQFPDTFCDVIYDSKLDFYNNPVKNKCQFSWYCDGKPDEIDDQRSWKQAQAVAYMLLSRNVMRGISEGSTHYHATYVSPKWAPTLYPIGRIGKHRFYKWL